MYSVGAAYFDYTLRVLMRWSAIAILAFLAAASAGLAADSPVRLIELTAEHLARPMGIGIARPRLSWKPSIRISPSM